MSRTGRSGRGGWARVLLRRILLSVAFLLAAVLGFGTFSLIKLQGNIDSIDITGQLGSNRPDILAQRDEQTDQLPLNILLVGSDTRESLTDADAFGGENSLTKVDHSDTTILLHVSADRKSAYGISIPRDSMVRRPDCKDPNASVRKAPIGMFNAAYTDGGIGCTVRTVEANTGVRIDHYAVVNFEGFRDMVDALGGVDICVAEPINDHATGLRLKAGMNHLDGTEATQYVRARKSIGDGSDLGRIGRQQAFLSALIREATDSGLLLRPNRLYGFLDAATQSVTMDPGMASVRRLSDLAVQVRGIKPENINFITVPTETYPADHNRVQWTSEADAIWEAVRLDRPLPGTTPEGAATEVRAPRPTVSPADIRVSVVNSSGTAGLGRQAGEVLTAQGFVVTGATNGTSGVDGVVIRYPAGEGEAAETLRAAFPAATMVPNEQLHGEFEVDLGKGAPDVAEVPNRVGTDKLPGQPLKARSAAPAAQAATDGGVPRQASDSACT